jgi:hypothetical protein
VIDFFHVAPPGVYLLTAYAKAEREDLRPGDLRVWARLVATIKKEVR